MRYHQARTIRRYQTIYRNAKIIAVLSMLAAIGALTLHA